MFLVVILSLVLRKSPCQKRSFFCPLQVAGGESLGNNFPVLCLKIIIKPSAITLTERRFTYIERYKYNIKFVSTSISNCSFRYDICASIFFAPTSISQIMSISRCFGCKQKRTLTNRLWGFYGKFNLQFCRAHFYLHPHLSPRLDQQEKVVFVLVRHHVVYPEMLSLPLMECSSQQHRTQEALVLQ